MSSKIERFEVVINDVVHMLTNDQLGDLVVDIDPAELENLRLEMAREKGEPEPVLYPEDELLGPDTNGFEEALNELVDLQDRMSKGMQMIEECNKEIKKAKGDSFAAWNLRRSKLWSHWFSLKNKCSDLASEFPGLWTAYFGAGDEELTSYLTSGDTEEVDTQAVMYRSQFEQQTDCFFNEVVA